MFMYIRQGYRIINYKRNTISNFAIELFLWLIIELIYTYAITRAVKELVISVLYNEHNGIIQVIRVVVYLSRVGKGEREWW